MGFWEEIERWNEASYYYRPDYRRRYVRIKDFTIAIQTAHANALLFNRDYFVTIGTDMFARAEKWPTTSCWRVNAQGEVWKEEYLLQDEGKGLKLLCKTRDEELESRLIVNR